MARQKGHRANKANDSFGTINNTNLYRGQYREEVYEDEEDTVESQDPSEEIEATPAKENSFASPQEESNTDYKKRYDDLKKHYDSKLDEWKQERAELSKAREVGQENGISAKDLPRTPEELEDFKAKYPDVYAIVETVSGLQAENRLSSLKQEVESLKQKEERLQVEAAFKELLNAHPDFAELKVDERFLTWLDQQPSSISDGIYRNNKDARWAIRVLDLYKSDFGITKTKSKKRESDPAMAVTKTTSRDISSEAGADKKVWKASEIGRMKPWEFEKLEAELDAARAEGRINYQQ